MKVASTTMVLLVAFCLSVMADDANPYASIVARNVFSLVPMPTNPPEEQKPADPPAKITPNGIMSLFGQLQVLFKVSTPPKPGQPPQDQSYVMSEGDRQDGIEVTRIDELAGMITFDNHGVIQKLALTAAPDVSTPSAPSGDGGHGFMPPGARRFGGRLGMARNMGNPPDGSYSGSYSNPNSNPNPNSTPYTGSQQQGQLSPEAQALLIENNYIQAKANNDPVAPLFPPTPLRGQSDASLAP
jgi:hypothetical protein